MLFSSAVTFALAATMVQANIHQSATVGVDITIPGVCKPIHLVQIGVGEHINIDKDKGKRDGAAAPKADFAVDQVEKLENGLYQVGLLFKTLKSDLLGEDLNPGSEAVISGLGADGNGQQTVNDSPFNFQRKVVVKPEKKNGLLCLPSGLHIGINVGLNLGAGKPKTPLLSKFQNAFGNPQYNLQQNDNDGTKTINNSKREDWDLLERELNIGVGANVDIDLLKGLNLLPNYCWDDCNPSSSSAPASSTEPPSSSPASSVPASSTPASNPSGSSGTPSSTVPGGPSSSGPASSGPSSPSGPSSSGPTGPESSGAPSSTGPTGPSSGEGSGVPSSTGQGSGAPSSTGPSSDDGSNNGKPSGSGAESSPAPTSVAPVSTATDIHTTVVTITSCEQDKCHEHAVTTGVTTVTENDTVYTTYCPLSTKTELHTTVVTITSCEDDKCHEVPVTTGLTTVTENNTVYTTYCPISTEAPAPAPGPSTQAPAPAPAPTTKAPAPAPAPAPSTQAPAPAPISKGPQESTVTSLRTSTLAAESTKATGVQQQSSSAPHSAAPEVSQAQGLGNSVTVSLSTIFAAVFIVFNI